MTESGSPLLNAGQLAALESAFHRGSSEASLALAKWIGHPSVVELDALEQLPMEEATGLLAESEEPICFCSAEMNGLIRGEMILAFDDTSGLALADMLLDLPPGTTESWTDMAQSAALETTNILACVYLNSLSVSLAGASETVELLPSPPRFNRDFAESLLEFALMGQAMASDQVIVARTTFEIDATTVHWTLLFVPDAPSMALLPKMLIAEAE